MQGMTRTTRLRRTAWRRLRCVARCLGHGRTIVVTDPRGTDAEGPEGGSGQEAHRQKTGQPRAVTEAEARATVQQLTALLERLTAPPHVDYRRDGTQVASVDGY
jgi:hypothetical protein